MGSMYDTGIRPVVDKWLLNKSKEQRDYGNYWSASSAGYCMRKVIFERLKVPYVTEDARKQRIFSSGTIFHEWLQAITKESGISIAQELELQDEELMIRGHIDDLVLVPELVKVQNYRDDSLPKIEEIDIDDTIIEYPKDTKPPKHLILYDYKTAHSKWFEYKRTNAISHYHKMQLGTYMYMLRNGVYGGASDNGTPKPGFIKHVDAGLLELTEARILHISKDDLRMAETILFWSDELYQEIEQYWMLLNAAWQAYNETGKLPECTCADHENGFLAKEKWNPYFYEGQPCSIEYFNEWKENNGR